VSPCHAPSESRAADAAGLGQRIVVVGASGSGKSTLAALLCERLQLPLCELDALYWTPDWKPPQPEAFVQRVREAVAGERWVVVGNYNIQREVSWAKAQAVVWLDLPLSACVTRIVRRSFRRWRSNELLWGTNRERFFQQFALWDQQQSLIAFTLRNHGVLRKRYQAAIVDPAWSQLAFHRLRSPRQIAAWLTLHTDRAPGELKLGARSA
jgi:adenylate kinase family enzyme